MGFIEDIDKGLRSMGKKLEKEDKTHIRADCPECGEKDIKVHKMPQVRSLFCGDDAEGLR